MKCNFAKFYELNNYLKFFSRLLTTEDIESKSYKNLCNKNCLMAREVCDFTFVL